MTEQIRDYLLVQKLGSGAMGEVFLGEHVRDQEKVAVKVLRHDVAEANTEIVTRFRREGQALRELGHPNIVQMKEAFEEGGQHYLIMEYVAGGDLKQLITQHPQGLPVARVLGVCLDLADALIRAHRLGIIHRDLKPANIMLTKDETPKLTDFGIAHFVNDQSLTKTGSSMGTFAYMSPEACMGQEPDERTDVWSFGVILYELLTGQRPFTGDSPVTLINNILTKPFDDIQDMRPGISDDLNDLIYRMLDKQREERISSVRLVGAEIEALLKGKPTTLRPIGEREQSIFTISLSDVKESRKHNLPRQTTEFVGRETEIRELTRLIASGQHPLMSLLGAGGMGKSRLAIEVGNQALNSFRDGVFFVELAKLSDPASIPIAIAEAADFRFLEQGTPREQILNYLRNKHLLLILDNFEHILDGRELVVEILTSAPEVTILVTSRTRLKLVEETVFTLESLAFPVWKKPEDAQQYAAVQLFIQSAKRARIDFELKAHDLTYLTRIVRLVEGVPLGILLAAAWVDMLSVEEIAEEIQNSVDFLESEATNLSERQRSMRATFDYSWSLLSDAERNTFAQMSVFRGGCTRQAARKVTGASLRILSALVNKSLLRRDQESGRFEIHELLRQLGAEYLEESGQERTIQDAHSTYYAEIMQEHLSLLHSGSQRDAVESIEVDLQNILTAWVWATTNHKENSLRQIGEPLYLFYLFRSRFTEGRETFGSTVGHLRDKSTNTDYGNIALSMLWWGRLMHHQPHALDIFHEAEPFVRQSNDGFIHAIWLQSLSIENWLLGQSDRAKSQAQEAIRLLQNLEQPFWLTQAQLQLAFIYRYTTEHIEESEALLQSALATCLSHDNYYGEGLVLTELAYLYITQLGNFERADMAIRESQTAFQKIGHTSGLVDTLLFRSEYFFLMGKLDEALALIERGLMIAEERGEPTHILNILIHKGRYINLLGRHAEAEKILLDAYSQATEKQLKYLRAVAGLHISDLYIRTGEFEQALKWARRELERLSDKHISCMFWITIGEISVHKHNLVEARHYLQQALQYSLDASVYEWVIWVGSIVPGLLLLEEKNEYAVEVASAIHHYPTCADDNKRRMQHFLKLAQEILSPEAYQNAYERGKQYTDIRILAQTLLDTVLIE